MLDSEMIQHAKEMQRRMYFTLIRFEKVLGSKYVFYIEHIIDA